MSLVGSIVGAFLVAAGRPAKQAERLQQLTRSQARLIDRIEQLEREIEGLDRILAAERALTDHWRGEAKRFARENRERREDMMQAAIAQQTMAHAQALAKQGWAATQQLAGQAQQTQYAQLQQYAQSQQNAYAGLCNCVPSRSQIWGAQHGLVQQLNDNTLKE